MTTKLKPSEEAEHIAALVQQGFTIGQIAEHRGVDVKTVLYKWALHLLIPAVQLYADAGELSVRNMKLFFERINERVVLAKPPHHQAALLMRLMEAEGPRKKAAICREVMIEDRGKVSATTNKPLLTCKCGCGATPVYATEQCLERILYPEADSPVGDRR